MQRKGLWITIAVAVLLVVGVAAVLLLRGDRAEPGRDAAEQEAKRTSVVAPETLGGRPRNTEGEMQTLVDTMKSSFKTAVPGSSTAEAGFYGTAAKRDILLMFAATSAITQPDKELDAIFKVGDSLKASNVVEVDPGPLGGKAKCGTGDASGTPLAICGWADGGSVGLVVWYFKGLDEAKAEFPTLRGQIEKKS